MVRLPWSSFKSFVTTKSSALQYFDINSNYYLYAFDGFFGVECLLPKDDGSDVTDFETNFKSNGNKLIIPNTQVIAATPYGNKNIIVNGVKKTLFGRNIGMQFALNQGLNNLSYTITYPWLKIIAIECLNGEALDKVDFKVYDTPQGTYSGVANALLNQFAFNVNISKDYYIRNSQYEMDAYQGIVLKFDYTSVSAKTIGINLIASEVV